MRRAAAAFGLGLVLTSALSAAQAGASHYLGGGRLPVELPVAFLVWAGLAAPLLEGVAAALGAGWALDVFAGTPWGLMVFLSVAVLLGSREARSSLAVHGWSGFAALTAAGTFLLGSGALLLERLTAAPDAAPAWGLLWRVLLQALLTAAAAAPLHPLLVRLERLRAGEGDAGILSG